MSMRNTISHTEWFSMGGVYRGLRETDCGS
jgi:hypothetical protein